VTADVMLVSAFAGPDLRAAVAAGEQPCPEFLRLEERHGVEHVDWGSIGCSGGQRSIGRSARHVRAALQLLDTGSRVLSDGEHLGIPLAMAMRTMRRAPRHVMIGHHLVSRAKRPWFAIGQAQRRIDTILVHSENQVDPISTRLHVPPAKIAVVPYAVDDTYWAPHPAKEEDLVVATGREHRDYDTLVRACPRDVRVFISASSTHSPHARAAEPDAWPANVERGHVPFTELRSLYARAAVVAVPLQPAPAAFGVTSLLEAMAMGKAVVATDNPALRSLVHDGVHAVLVPPGDADRLRGAVTGLLADPERRRQLGAAARSLVAERYGLDAYVDALADHLRGERVTAQERA
jgi:glycosyltransferase involved in cell wall biosynthesis